MIILNEHMKNKRKFIEEMNMKNETIPLKSKVTSDFDNAASRCDAKTLINR